MTCSAYKEEKKFSVYENKTFSNTIKETGNK